MAQTWVGEVGWSQTFKKQCFYGIFDHHFRLKVHLFYAESPQPMKSHTVATAAGNSFYSKGGSQNQDQLNGRSVEVGTS